MSQHCWPPFLPPPPPPAKKLEKYSAIRALSGRRRERGGGDENKEMLNPLLSKHFSCQSHAAGFKSAFRSRSREAKLGQFYPMQWWEKLQTNKLLQTEWFCNVVFIVPLETLSYIRRSWRGVRRVPWVQVLWDSKIISEFSFYMTFYSSQIIYIF